MMHKLPYFSKFKRVPVENLFPICSPKKFLNKYSNNKIYKIYYVNPIGNISDNLNALSHNYSLLIPIIPNSQNSTNIQSDSIVPKLLPLLFKNKNFISGLMPLTSKQRETLNSNTLLGSKMRNLIVETMTHIIYNFTLEKHNIFSENIFYAIRNIFSSISGTNPCPDLYDIIGKSLLPLTQSLCVYFWGNASFNYSTFKEICDRLEINCESFKEQEIKISHFIELYFARQLKTLIMKNSKFIGEYHMINPDGFRNLPIYFNELESQERTGQKHCDLLIIEQDNTKNLNDLMKLYIDIKTYVTFGSEHCRFSLFHSNIHLLLRYISDMPVTIKNFITKEKLTGKHPIILLYEKLISIKNEKKISGMDYNKTYITFNKMLQVFIETFTDPKFQKLNLSFASYVGIDTDFLEFYNNVIKPELDKIEKAKETINNMIPEKSLINHEQHQSTIETFIQEMLPEEMKHKALEYFQNNILLKTTL